MSIVEHNNPSRSAPRNPIRIRAGTARVQYLIVLLALTALPAAFAGGSTRWYVNANNDPPDPRSPICGRDWRHAFTDLETALTVACPGDVIWVAKSTPAQPAYYPSVRYPRDPNGPDDPRRVTFRIPPGVRVLGGFRGFDDYTDPDHPYRGEVEVCDRDPQQNPTVLDGDIEQNDNLNDFPFGASFADNAYHVVFFHGAEFQGLTRLSGFVIRGGHADGLAANDPANYFGVPDDAGGGVIVPRLPFGDRARPLLDQIVFERNYAQAADAGVSLPGEDDRPMTNCCFEENRVGDVGDSSASGCYGQARQVSHELEGSCGGLPVLGGIPHACRLRTNSIWDFHLSAAPGAPRRWKACLR